MSWILALIHKVTPRRPSSSGPPDSTNAIENAGDSKTSFLGTPKYRLRLGRLAEPAHPDEVAFSWLSYDLSRYFFEFCRNLLVVGALRYAADKTGNTFLLYMSYASVLMLVIFTYSFVCFWDLRLFYNLLRKSNIGALLDSLLNLLISFAIMFPFYGVIISVTTQMEGIKQ